MSARILILTAAYGEGHNAAARALATACDAEHGAGTAGVVDVFALAAPQLNAVTRRGYLGLINRAPGLWSAVYRWLDRSTLAPRMLRGLRAEKRVLRQRVAAEQPTAICCTYPVYAYLLAALARDGAPVPPVYNVVTDSITINSLWWRAGAAGWFVPNEESRDVMLAAGLDPRRLHVSGFPVPAFFREHASRLAPPDLAAGGMPRVLYIVNSHTPGAAETARRLLRETNWEVTCTVGRDEALRRELAALAVPRRAPTQILGWTSEIPRLLMTHHVLVSKAGGATTQEALAARCPMIVNQIVPGQEQGNYELLRRHGTGALALTPESVVTELQRAFHAGGRVWRHWRAALAPLSRPDAARIIATAVLRPGTLATAPGPGPIPFPSTAPA